jgi:3-methyladenine DNA glycosylase AlkD
MKKHMGITEITKNIDKERAVNLARFFKTGKGEYGEGDKFLGLTVPTCRSLVQKLLDISDKDLEYILTSPYHEERLIALLILVKRFERSKDEKIKKNIFSYYLSHTKYINNWDLVDLSAPRIVGKYLVDKKDREKILLKLAKSKLLWERRIAVLATSIFIYEKDPEITFKLVDLLMKDKEDLMHKACGWMLREIGKKCGEDVLKKYLKDRYMTMPRTMLRYSIEKFDETTRKLYLNSKI